MARACLDALVRLDFWKEHDRGVLSEVEGTKMVFSLGLQDDAV
jgi:hypothetical protein